MTFYRKSSRALTFESFFQRSGQGGGEVVSPQLRSTGMFAGLQRWRENHPGTAGTALGAEAAHPLISLSLPPGEVPLAQAAGGGAQQGTEGVGEEAAAEGPAEAAGSAEGTAEGDAEAVWDESAADVFGEARSEVA